MGRKSVLRSYKMFDAADISANATSAATDVTPVDKASIHVRWTGTSPVGTLVVQYRNNNPDFATPTDPWMNLAFSAAITISGNSGEHQIVFNEMPFTDIRLVYTATSGTGVLTATLSMKSVGA